jgi:hypothetical protein
MKGRADFKTTYVALVEAERAAEFERAVREPQPLDFETAASWRALRPRLEPRRWYVPPALAAALLLALVGSSTWFLARQGFVHDRGAPRPNAAVVDLVADASRRTGIGGEPQEVVDAGGGATLVLTPDAVLDEPAYELVILDAGGSVIWTVPGLEPHPADQTFTVFLPPGSLLPGVYRIELFGTGSDRTEPVATYRIRWVGATSSSPD